MSSVDDETIMEVLTDSDAPRLTTTEVADELPLARGTVRSRLQSLADEGRLDREREGRDVVWFLPERADEVPPEPVADPDPGDGDEEDDDPAAESGPDGDAEDGSPVDAESEDGHGDDPDGEPAEPAASAPQAQADEAVDGGSSGDAPEDATPDTGSTAAVTERGEAVATDADAAPSAAAATGDPLARPDDDTLVRAAIAGLLLALVYYAIRRIGSDS